MGLKRLISLVFGATGARAGGAFFSFLAQILLATTLPAREVGLYFICVSLASLAGLLLTAGYPAIALTFLPRYQAACSARLRAGFLKAARRDILFCFFVLAAISTAAVGLMPLATDLRWAIGFGMAAAPLVALIRINNALANCSRQFHASVLPEYLLRPALFLVVVATLDRSSGTMSLNSVLSGYVMIAAVVATLQTAVLGRNSFFTRAEGRFTASQLAAWRGRAGAYLIVSIATISFADLVILTGGAVLIPADVATLGIAVRLAVLVGFVTQMAQIFTIPDLTNAVQAGHRRKGHALLKRSVLVGTVANAVMLIGCAVGGDLVLSLFGPAYAEGKLLLMLLVVSQLVRAASGMNAQLLAIRGEQVAVAATSLAGMATMLFLSLLLAPHTGVASFGIAAVVSDLVWFFVLAAIVQKRVGYRGDFIALFARSMNFRPVERAAQG